MDGREHDERRDADPVERPDDGPGLGRQADEVRHDQHPEHDADEGVANHEGGDWQCDGGADRQLHLAGDDEVADHNGDERADDQRDGRGDAAVERTAELECRDRRPLRRLRVRGGHPKIGRGLALETEVVHQRRAVEIPEGHEHADGCRSGRSDERVTELHPS